MKSNPAITATHIKNHAMWMGTIFPHGSIAHCRGSMLPPPRHRWRASPGFSSAGSPTREPAMGQHPAPPVSPPFLRWLHLVVCPGPRLRRPSSAEDERRRRSPLCGFVQYCHLTPPSPRRRSTAESPTHSGLAPSQNRIACLTRSKEYEWPSVGLRGAGCVVAL